MTAYLSIGSNEGNKKENLETAVRLLQEVPGLSIKKISSFYETEPWGGVVQDYFLNQVLEIETSLEPLELLHCCQEIEREMGRKRKIHWGPRIIDIDILSYGNIKINSAELILPHPYMEEREFVLAPLREIAPDFILPSGKFAKNVKRNEMVKKISL